MKEVRKVHYVKGVFVCPKCRQSYVQEKWIESWRVRCHRCDYRGRLDRCLRRGAHGRGNVSSVTPGNLNRFLHPSGPLPGLCFHHTRLELRICG